MDAGAAVAAAGPIPPTTFPPDAGVAQLVEQLIRNQQAVGSNPIIGFYRVLLEFSLAEGF